MNLPAAEFDEERHVQSLQRDGLDGEEVDCEDPLGPCSWERAPGKEGAPREPAGPSPSWRRIFFTVLESW